METPVSGSCFDFDKGHRLRVTAGGFFLLTMAAWPRMLLFAQADKSVGKTMLAVQNLRFSMYGTFDLSPTFSLFLEPKTKWKNSLPHNGLNMVRAAFWSYSFSICCQC